MQGRIFSLGPCPVANVQRASVHSKHLPPPPIQSARYAPALLRGGRRGSWKEREKRGKEGRERWERKKRTGRREERRARGRERGGGEGEGEGGRGRDRKPEAKELPSRAWEGGGRAKQCGHTLCCRPLSVVTSSTCSQHTAYVTRARSSLLPAVLRGHRALCVCVCLSVCLSVVCLSVCLPVSVSLSLSLAVSVSLLLGLSLSPGSCRWGTGGG
eukprot:497554-Rhodomonas_salina.2